MPFRSPTKPRRVSAPKVPSSCDRSHSVSTARSARRVAAPVEITRDTTVEVRCASPRSAPASRRLHKVVEQLAAALKVDVDAERGREESTSKRTMFFVNGEETAAECFLSVVRMIAAAHRGTVSGAAPVPRIHARVVSSGAFFNWLP